jgi:hypothetical protein
MSLRSARAGPGRLPLDSFDGQLTRPTTGGGRSPVRAQIHPRLLVIRVTECG